MRNGMTRRDLLVAGLAGAGLAVAKQEKRAGVEGVSLAEDLMREHGVLLRVLLVYREAQRRMFAREELPPEALSGAASLVRRFIEDYHEKLEENYLFPRFRKAGVLVELVDVLERQHRSGRVLTETTLLLSTAAGLKDPDDRRKLHDALRQFVRMYEPHEAREDTVLFPAFKKIVSPSEYDALGEEFEKKEHRLFGERGFEKSVDEVAQIEKKLGIYDLSQLTPRI